jgi:hypothetical protein
MIEVGDENGLYVRNDGSFYAFCGDVILKADQPANSLFCQFTGIASTADQDRDKEVILQKGLDFSPFIEHGEYNWNHIPHAMVGEPTGRKAWYDGGKWLSEGRIIKGLPIWDGYTTDMVIQQHNQLRKSGTNRGLCQSIEGKVMQRSPCGRYVQKATVYNIALTFRPVNPNCTVAVLAKSLMGQSPILQRDSWYKSLSVPEIQPAMKEDLEGGDDESIESHLIKHCMKKHGLSVGEAKRKVRQYMASKISK